MISSSGNKVLVTGATGMLGTEVVRLLRQRGQDVAEAIWPPEHHAHRLCLDITDKNSLEELIDWVQPVVIFNCSAFTDVDGAEEKEEQAMAVNGRGVQYIAEICGDHNIRLIHVSTDYVFDGRGNAGYQPTQQTNPQSAYGRSKLAGEQAISNTLSAPRHKWFIVRTSWLFGKAGKNFVDTIVNLAQDRDELKVVNDQIGCPTYAPDLARCLVDLAETDARGVFHFCNGPACSWFDLAAEAIRLSNLACKVLPCSTSEFPRPAPRPAYSVLDCSDTFEVTGWTARSWKETLREHLGLKG